ncbi:6-pyruvoyl-tetrahydropterin synthase-related protein [Sphingomonas flavescens]|uniref:6-pyruvoyl-tetrahydropterin synthase-related protein n=1 Tax=Sphingomonas flavescens TaxID=3132797 RepID=UPI0028039948|nr:6-pyruvoyl-tetrahydropterin synthase-related protein [Sphingomonas limnosediminicola]
MLVATIIEEQRRSRDFGRLQAATFIVVAACILTLPLAIGPARLNDSFWIDQVWLEQFAREIGRGVAYPRWLPQSHGGLGSPVFYYYPPLAFYAGTPFLLLGLKVSDALAATFFAGYLASGAAMYFWLRRDTENPFLGTLVFMVAPYHTFNCYNRGALAEFMATAIIPLLAAGVWRVNQTRSGSFILVALGYAALIATHLPLALLTSLFLVAPMAAARIHRERANALPIALALATGIGLAAVYWVPAFWLEPYRDSASLWSNPILKPSNWTFWNPEFRASRAYIGILVISASLALPLSMLACRNRSAWAVLGLLCLLLTIGTIPLVWELPMLRSVQFPFRLLPIAEFGLATAIARLPWASEGLALRLLPLLTISAFTIAAKPVDQGVTAADVRAHADVPDNLPPGHRPYSWPSTWARDVARKHPAKTVTGDMTTEARFYFPAWQVSCGNRRTAGFPAPESKLLSYRGKDCVAELGSTPAEAAGKAVSLINLFLLVLIMLPALRDRLASRPKWQFRWV